MSDTKSDETVVVMRKPPKLGGSTLCGLMDVCVPEDIEDEKDMQRFIDRFWPALCCLFEVE